MTPRAPGCYLLLLLLVLTEVHLPMQDFTLFSLLGLMLMSLHFLGFCQVQAECKGKVF